MTQFLTTPTESVANDRSEAMSTDDTPTREEIEREELAQASAPNRPSKPVTYRDRFGVDAERALLKGN